jgi:hypothetical protein
VIAANFSNAELWKMGTPISKARQLLAPKEMILRLAQAPKINLSGPNEFLAVHKESPHASLTEVMQIVTTRNGIISEENKKNEAIQLEIDRNFMSLVRSKKIRCFGFELPRSVSATPVELISEYWTYFPNWHAGTYKHDGLNLINLRVITSTQLPAPSQEVERTKAGRPSVRPDIFAAIVALQANGCYDHGRISANFAPIRTWIKQNRPDSRAASEGFGDDVIRKAIKEHAENSIKQGMEIL